MPPTKTKTLAKNVETADVALWNRVAELRRSGALANMDAPEDAVDDMVARILDAETDEEMFGSTTPIASLVGVTIQVTGANFLESNKRKTPYAVFQWRAADGRDGITSNGGVRLVATLINAVSRGALPLTCRVGSAEVEYEEGQFGTTYFLEPVR